MIFFHYAKLVKFPKVAYTPAAVFKIDIEYTSVPLPVAAEGAVPPAHLTV
jgi:hypothetical protein